MHATEDSTLRVTEKASSCGQEMGTEDSSSKNGGRQGPRTSDATAT